MATFAVGVDFGTSTTVACMRWPDGRRRALLFDGSPLLPSAVFLGDDGNLLVGRDALHTARAAPDRFEPNPKQRLDDGVVVLGGREVPVAHLIAAVLRRVGHEVAQVIADQPVAVTLTCPATWPEHRRRALLDGATVAGIVAPTLVSEPVAAAAYYDAAIGPAAAPGGLVVYDLGGGTFDVSVVTRQPTGYVVRAADGLADVGGLDIDATIVAYLGALCGADPLWTRLDQPTSAADLRARRQLWDDARTAKEMLSRVDGTTIHLPLLDRGVPLGRAQFEQLARPLLERTVTAARSALRRATLDPRLPVAVFLVGGASRMPQVTTLLQRAFGAAPTAIDQPELAVAEGCLLVTAPAQPAGPPLPVPAPPPAPRPPWTELVQVIDLAVGDVSGYTLRCYLPPANPDDDPTAMFLTRGGRLLLFDDLDQLVDLVRNSDNHNFTELVEWPTVVASLDTASAARYLVECFELELILANVRADPREWVPKLFVAAYDLATELGTALQLRPVRTALAEDTLLDRICEVMRWTPEGTAWRRNYPLRRDEITLARETWVRVVTAIEATAHNA